MKGFKYGDLIQVCISLFLILEFYTCNTDLV